MTPPRPPLHPAVVSAQQEYHPDIVREVAQAAAENRVLVVGVSGLAPARKARRLLDELGVPYRYLQYGSYFSGWRRRLALKLWVGWPTFPLIFIDGTFIGGASDLRALHERGELKALLPKA